MPAIFGTSTVQAQKTATIIRPANTTTYTANTAWNTSATSALCVPVPILGCARPGVANGCLIQQIDIFSSANQSTKLNGILWLFNQPPVTPIGDNATFTLSAADFANVTGNMQGFAFTMTNTQAAAAGNAGISLTGVTFHAQTFQPTTPNPASGALYCAVQVVNAYVPVSGEALTITLHTLDLDGC